MKETLGKMQLQLAELLLTHWLLGISEGMLWIEFLGTYEVTLR